MRRNARSNSGRAIGFAARSDQPGRDHYPSLDTHLDEPLTVEIETADGFVVATRHYSLWSALHRQTTEGGRLEVAQDIWERPAQEVGY